MKKDEANNIGQTRTVLCSVCHRSFYQKSAIQTSTTICQHCGGLTFLQSTSLLAEKAANQQALVESLLTNLRRCSVFDLGSIFKKILATAFNQNSPHCEQFFVKPGFISSLPYTLHNDPGKTDNSFVKALEEFTDETLGKYRLKSFNQMSEKSEPISETVRCFSCTRISSKALGDESFCVIVLFHHGERIWSLGGEIIPTHRVDATDVSREKYIELLENVMRSNNTDLGVLITTEDYGKSLPSIEGKINIINGNQLANMMIDLQIGVKPVYQLHQINDELFFRY